VRDRFCRVLCPDTAAFATGSVTPLVSPRTSATEWIFRTFNRGEDTIVGVGCRSPALCIISVVIVVVAMWVAAAKMCVDGLVSAVSGWLRVPSESACAIVDVALICRTMGTLLLHCSGVELRLVVNRIRPRLADVAVMH